MWTYARIFVQFFQNTIQENQNLGRTEFFHPDGRLHLVHEHPEGNLNILHSQSQQVRFPKEVFYLKIGRFSLSHLSQMGLCCSQSLRVHLFTHLQHDLHALWTLHSCKSTLNHMLMVEISKFVANFSNNLFYKLQPLIDVGNNFEISSIHIIIMPRLSDSIFSRQINLTFKLSDHSEICNKCRNFHHNDTGLICFCFGGGCFASCEVNCKDQFFLRRWSIGNCSILRV